MSPISLSDDALEQWPEEALELLAAPSRMTEDAFDDWISTLERARAEWVDGEVILMSPTSVRHFLIFGWLYQILERFVRVRGLGTVLGDGVAVRLRANGRSSRRFPDLMFVAQDRLHLIQENYLAGPPDLAVEIVSPDSEKRDWVEKPGEYAAAGIREYWIIDPKAERFEAFRLDSTGAFVSFYNQSAGQFTSLVVSGFKFRIEWLWEEVLSYPEDALKEMGISA
ncbi:MAG: hypothetical protein JWM11_3577 [Planctomycetaceae bacterium]|nr:hypothetical protein [Planctomycetaceae bacterium]